MNGRIFSEVNSEHDYQTVSQHWIPLQSKDYSDTEMKPFKSDADDNEDYTYISTQPTAAVQSVLLPGDENPSKETIPVNRKMSGNDLKYQYEAFNDGEKLDHFVAYGSKIDGYPLMNTEAADENITKGEIEGRNNKIENRNQLSQIENEVQDEVQTNGPTTGVSDVGDFAETRREELEDQWQLRKEIPTEGSEKFPGILNREDNDDVCITIEDENNDMQDNKT